MALNALVFIAREVFELEVGEIGDFVRAKNRKKIPVVMTKEETRDFFAELEGEKLLMAQLQYAAGLRVSELMRLRVQDLDLKRNQVVVRCGKGGKDRVAPLSEKLVAAIEAHLVKVRALFEEDLQNPELAGVYLPGALARKHKNAGKDWRWQWLWPSRQISKDPRSGLLRRHHVLAQVYQAAVRKAGIDAGLTKRITSHTLRHSFATHLLEDGVDIVPVGHPSASLQGQAPRRAASQTISALARSVGQCRICWGMLRSKRHKSTRTSCRNRGSACGVRWIAFDGRGQRTEDRGQRAAAERQQLSQFWAVGILTNFENQSLIDSYC